MGRVEKAKNNWEKLPEVVAIAILAGANVIIGLGIAGLILN